jgi:aminoglycoside phosphotransferase (APT) family kinase protein
MPAAEVEVTVELVGLLLADQRPDLADLDISALASGWDNFTFLLGSELVARFPRRQVAVELIANEARWLPEVAARLPLPVPYPVFVGEPGRGYPWIWYLAGLLPGEPAAPGLDLDLEGCAADLGGFLRALHHPAPPGAPVNLVRGVPLAKRDRATRERLELLSEWIDTEAALDRWATALAVPIYDGGPVWIHGDLHPNNLLVLDGLISGVVDFGDITSGDPATDLAVAWMLFPERQRRRFRDAYGKGDDASWERARGWALSLASAHLAHSADNARMGEIGLVTMERVLTDG